MASKYIENVRLKTCFVAHQLCLRKVRRIRVHHDGIGVAVDDREALILHQ